MLPAHAGIVIYGTRIIYPAEKKEVVVQLMNEGKSASLVQAWIDDGDTSLPPEKIHVPFMLTPPVVRVPAGSGQQLKIKKIPASLPEDKESLFYINVLDIPPNNAESSGKNIIKFAMQNRIKFIWRPHGIPVVNNESFRKLELTTNSNGLSVKNYSANWITVTDVKAGKVKINGQTIIVGPFSTQAVSKKPSAERYYDLTIIDDSGNYISSKINVK